MYKLKMKVGLVFDRGREFIILLDISVHSLWFHRKRSCDENLLKLFTVTNYTLYIKKL